jgi:predicted amidohydrolase
MRPCSLLVAFTAAVTSTLFAGPRTPDAATWQSWSPRDEIAPTFSQAPAAPNSAPTLSIKTTKASDFGAWRNVLRDLRPGTVYRFTAWYRSTNVPDERRSVIARLQWLDASDKPVKPAVRPPEYVPEAERREDWTKVESIVRAPEGIAGLDVQLSLGFTPNGSVTWRDVSLSETNAPAERNVRVMTVHHRARGTKSAADNVAQYSKLIRDAAEQKPDIICLPEGITVVGTGKKYFDVGEAVPGPTTESLGQLARELRTYIVAGLYEREAPLLYNTAVLIDRDGKLIGRYRKTHLPREEWEAGITPGETYPVFETDFGRIALLVCWDLQFPEPWRAVALQGAQLVLLPIWGGNEILLRARAIENHVFAVSSSYDMKSCVVAPDGEILADATKHGPVATALVNLDRKIYQPWLGDMSTRTWKERRGDLPAFVEAAK